LFGLLQPPHRGADDITTQPARKKFQVFIIGTGSCFFATIFCKRYGLKPECGIDIAAANALKTETQPGQKRPTKSLITNP
jgi:hypothetical protein